MGIASGAITWGQRSGGRKTWYHNPLLYMYMLRRYYIHTYVGMVTGERGTIPLHIHITEILYTYICRYGRYCRYIYVGTKS